MKLIDVVLPVRNEEKSIINVLRSLLDQHKLGIIFKLNLIIVDGRSTDKTLEFVRNFFSNNLLEGITYEIITNLKGSSASSNFNLGFLSGSSPLIMRLDGHSILSNKYIYTLLVKLNCESDKVIGGRIKHFSSTNSLIGQSIIDAMENRILTADAFRAKFLKEGKCTKEVDTIAFGLQKRETFLKGGLYDEQMKRNQDDLHCNLQKKNGVKIYLCNEIEIKQKVRDNYILFAKQYFQWGFYKPLVFYKSKKTPRPKLLIFICILFLFLSLLFIAPKIFLFFVCLTPLMYFFLSDGGFVNRIFFVFASIIMHFSYSLGFMLGIFFILIGNT